MDEGCVQLWANPAWQWSGSQMVQRNSWAKTESPGTDSASLQGAELPSAEFASLKGALDAYNMTEIHEPTWLPKGYALEGLDAICLDDPSLQTFQRPTRMARAM